MAISKEKLFEAFGELLYALARADGSIQEEEKELIAKIIRHHRYEFDILFSFKYEVNKSRSFNETYTKAMETFKEYGPFEGYPDFKIILEDLARSCEGISKEERELIDRFYNDLTAYFKNH